MKAYIVCIIFFATAIVSCESNQQSLPKPPYNLGASDSLYDAGNPMATAGEHIFFLTKELTKSQLRLEAITIRSVETDDDPLAVARDFRNEVIHLQKITRNLTFWANEQYRLEQDRTALSVVR